MVFKINNIGDLASRELEKYVPNSAIGKVIQVFNNTVYVRTRNNELICITTKEVRSPVNLNFTNNIDFKTEIHIDDLVHINDKREVMIGAFRFNTDNAITYSRSNTTGIKDGIHGRTEFSIKILTLFDTSGTILDSRSLMAKKISSSFKDISDALCNEETKDIKNYLENIIGLGNGFTPSGDDFTVGFLFCLNRIFLSMHQQPIHFVISSDTNWISRKFIQYSQDDNVIEPLEKFVNFLLLGDGYDNFPLMDLIRVGHYSGIDISVGAILATVILTKKNQGSIHNLFNSYHEF